MTVPAKFLAKADQFRFCIPMLQSLDRFPSQDSTSTAAAVSPVGAIDKPGISWACLRMKLTSLPLGMPLCQAPSCSPNSFSVRSNAGSVTSPSSRKYHMSDPVNYLRICTYSRELLLETGWETASSYGAPTNLRARTTFFVNSPGVGGTLRC